MTEMERQFERMMEVATQTGHNPNTKMIKRNPKNHMLILSLFFQPKPCTSLHLLFLHRASSYPNIRPSDHHPPTDIIVPPCAFVLRVVCRAGGVRRRANWGTGGRGHRRVAFGSQREQGDAGCHRPVHGYENETLPK